MISRKNSDGYWLDSNGYGCKLTGPCNTTGKWAVGGLYVYRLYGNARGSIYGPGYCWVVNGKILWEFKGR